MSSRFAAGVRQLSRETVACTKTGQICSDCQTLTTCVQDTAVAQQSCAQINELLPFCSENSCSANNTCGDSFQSAFDCSSDGVFPDPSDCTTYHVCKNGSVSDFKCPAGFVYFSKKKICRRQSSQSFCQTVQNCNKDNNQRLIPYQHDQGYFAFCQYQSASNVIMFKCNDELHEIYDSAISACRYNCRSEGQYVDGTDCTGYVLCSKQSNKWVPQSLKCPTQYWFSGGNCITGNCTQDAKDCICK